MADELDPRLEARLREALHADADTLPVSLRPQELSRLASERRRRWSGRRLSLLASAAVIAVAAGGATVLALGRPAVPAAQPPNAAGLSSSLEAPSPSPSASPFELASYAALEAALVEMSPISPTLLKGEHPEAGAGAALVTTDLGPVGNAAYVDVGVSCSGGPIKFWVRVGETPIGSGQRECDSRPMFFTLLGSPGSDAQFTVTAMEQVKWRIVVNGAAIATSPGPTPKATVAASPSLPPVGPGETTIVSLDLTEADGSANRTGTRPDGTDAYMLHAACTGDGTLDLNVDGVQAHWDCGTVSAETFTPGLGGDTNVVAGVTGNARFLLRLDAVDWAAQPYVTWQPPTLSLTGPDMNAGDTFTVHGFPGCGRVWTPQSGTGGISESCGPSWQPVAVALNQRPGTAVTVSLPTGWTITGVSAAVARNASILPAGRAPVEQTWSGSLSGNTWTFKVPPLGDWGVRLTVSAEKDGDSFRVPYYGRIVVTP